MTGKITSNTKLEEFPEIISIKDIASYLRVSETIIKGLVADKTIPSVRIGKKMVRIKTKDFVEYLNKTNE